MKKVNRSVLFSAVIFCLIFLLLLLCNTYTPKMSDDFSYHYSFDDKERITSIFQIFPSMAAHAHKMNGRLVAHFFVQIFEMLPKGIFNVVNSAMFTLQLFLLYRMGLSGLRDKKNNPFLLLLLFGLVWIFQPAFGQVNLWLDGACNYLWAITFGLAFIYPYIRELTENKRISNPVNKVLFVILGLLVGAYSENGSAAVIFIAVALTAASCIVYRRAPSLHGCAAVIASVCGYISIYLCPAEMAKKGKELDFLTFKKNLMECIEVLRSFWILLAICAVLFTLCILSKVDIRHITTAAILSAGSLAGNFIMIFASYYDDRSAFCVVILLTAAASVLAGKLFDEYNTLLLCFIAVLMLPTAYNVLIGLDDIHYTYSQIKSNEQHIYSCIEENISDVTINTITVNTKYSGAYKLKYIDTTTTETWPNKDMARYYGVNSIIGKTK